MSDPIEHALTRTDEHEVGRCAASYVYILCSGCSLRIKKGAVRVWTVVGNEGRQWHEHCWDNRPALAKGVDQG